MQVSVSFCCEFTPFTGALAERSPQETCGPHSGQGQPENSGLAAWDAPQVDLVVKDLWGGTISQIPRFWSTREGNKGVWTQKTSAGQQG